MGVAAYNRGTAVLRRQIDSILPDHHATLFVDLNARRKGTVKLVRDTVIRIDDRGRFWLMNRPEEGWSSYGRAYSNLREIVDHYAVHLIGLSRDDCSQIIPVIAL